MKGYTNAAKVYQIQSGFATEFYQIQSASQIACAFAQLPGLRKKYPAFQAPPP